MKEKIYEGQTILQFTIDPEIDLTGIVTATIKYIDPVGSQGTYAGVVVADKVTFDAFPEAGNPGALIPGKYRVWLKLINGLGKNVPTEPFEFTVYHEGT